MSLRPLALTLLLILPAPLAAEGPHGADCVCRDTYGREVPVGEFGCLVYGGKAIRALCGMSLNVTAWRPTGETCAPPVTG